MVKTYHIKNDERARILEDLRRIPNVAQVAKKYGRSCKAISCIAHEAGISLCVGAKATQETTLLLSEICDAHFSQSLKELGLSSNNNYSLSEVTSTNVQRWKEIIGKLRDLYPEKEKKIAELETIACAPHVSAAQIKKKITAETQEDLREGAGRLLHDWREACGITIADLQERIKSPIVKKNMPRMDNADRTLASSIYREGIAASIEILSTYRLPRGPDYRMELEKIRDQLRR